MLCCEALHPFAWPATTLCAADGQQMEIGMNTKEGEEVGPLLDSLHALLTKFRNPSVVQ